jgi:hypothetical protein
MKHVKEKWATFDCVVVVMDGKQGVNSEEQVNLLNLVKESMDTKEVPVHLQQVDDPTKTAGLIAEARLKVEEIFAVGCRRRRSTKSLRRVVRPLCCLVSIASLYSSAVHMLIRQSASLMSLEQFQPLTRNDREAGTRPDRPTPLEQTSEEEKIQETYEILIRQSEEGRQQLLDKFLAVLAHFVGGVVNASLSRTRSRRLCVHPGAVREELQTMCFPPDD